MPDSLDRIDSYPYRHRVGEVMGHPLAATRPGTTLAEAARDMRRRDISSLVVIDQAGRPAGIVTERDVIEALARHGGGAADIPLGSVMSSPVATIRRDSFLYAALGRMERLGLRHLVAVDEAGLGVGMVTARALLRLRVSDALVLGDEVAAAGSAADMRIARARLPALVRDLIDEGVDGTGVAAVASSVLRDLTARAAQLAERDVGPAPAPYCVLLLGSGGRRESLFSADQDNAVIHAAPAADTLYFAELGRLMCETLNQAGIPFCSGGVMASAPEWRHELDGWTRRIEQWIAHAAGPELLNVHIFVDFRPIHGDTALAMRLREILDERAARSPRFLHAMAQASADLPAPLGLFGRFVTHDGLLDLKASGLLPLTAAIRILALKHAIPATGTAERLDALAGAGHLNADEAKALRAALDLMLLLLAQSQSAALLAGSVPDTRIDPKRLTSAQRRQLKQAFKTVNALTWVMRNALSTV